MGIAADGSTCSVQILENGVIVEAMDGITGYSSTVDIATRSRLMLGRQGSSIEQDITGSSGSIPVALITPAIFDMVDRYIQALLIKQRTNISCVETYYFPETGDTRAYVHNNIKLTSPDIAVARQQDTTLSLAWTCGDVAVLR